VDTTTKASATSTVVDEMDSDAIGNHSKNLLESVIATVPITAVADDDLNADLFHE
ncbi:conserved hypothetical protein, partial [Ricinus communis]